MSEVDETMKRLQSHKGVTGLIVIDKEGKFSDKEGLGFLWYFFLGIPIRSTLDNSTTVQYAGLITQLANKARSVVSDTMHHDDSWLHVIMKYDTVIKNFVFRFEILIHKMI